MVNVRTGPSVLLVVILCHSAFGTYDWPHMDREFARMKKYGQNLKENVNWNVDPCQDFANYVNDGFVLSKMNEFNFEDIEAFYNYYIETARYSTQTGVQGFHYSCVSDFPETYLIAITELTNERKVSKALHHFDPTTDGVDMNLFSWSNLIGVLQSYDVTAFVSGYATANDNGTMTFHLAPGKFDLTQTEFWNGDLKSVLQYYGLGENEAIDLIRSLEEFERKFSVREATEIETNMTIGELQNKFPDFKWEEYFKFVAGTKKDINEFRQVTVTDLEKIEEYYNAHSFPVQYETAVAYYFFKLHAKLNMEYNTVKNDGRMCYINAFNLFKEDFANGALQNLDEDDEANMNDTIRSVIYAVSKLADLETRQAIEASLNETLNEPSIETQQDEYQEHVKKHFHYVIEYSYLFNYLRAYNSHRIRQIAVKHKGHLDKIGYRYYVHQIPRLALLATVGYQLAYETLKKYNVRIKEIGKEHCQEFFDGIAPYKVLLDAVDYLEEQDILNFDYESFGLSRFKLTAKKLVHILYGKILVGQNKGTDKRLLSSAFLQVEDFRKSYECSPPSDLSHGCYV